MRAIAAWCVWLVAGWTACDVMAALGVIPAVKAVALARSVLRLTLLVVAGMILLV